MEYFYMRQDERYSDVPTLRPLHEQLDLWKLEQLKPEDIPTPLILDMQASKESTFLDYMEGVFPLVSASLMQVLKLYAPQTICKHVMLLHTELSMHQNMYLPFLEDIEVMEEESEVASEPIDFKPMPVRLDPTKLGKRSVFQIRESHRSLVIVRLDVAESILRRGLRGVRFAPVSLALKEEQEHV